jgi:hypothetical protein
MNDFHQSVPPSRRNGRRAELGRAGITGLAAIIVTLTGAGLVAGCGGHGSSPSATPTVVITKTETAAPASAPSTPAADPTEPSTPAPAVSDSATPGASGAAATTGDGTQLGAYSFVLTNGYGAPLGPSVPTQSQMVAVNSGASYDIMFNGGIAAGSDEKIVSLPNGATPTYSACTTGTAFISYPAPDKGTAFCIIETNGQIAGVVVSGVSTSPADTLGFKVTIWKYVS